MKYFPHAKTLSNIINPLVFTLQLKKESITDAMEISYVPTQAFYNTTLTMDSTLPYMSLQVRVGITSVFYKDQIVTILGFADHVDYVETV